MLLWPPKMLVLMASAGAPNGVFFSASNKADMRVVDVRGNVLARVDAAGLETYGTALSADGRFLAAATFTPDVKVCPVKTEDRSLNWQ